MPINPAGRFSAVQDRRRSERGFGVVTVVAIAVPLIIVSGTMLGVVVSNHNETEQRAVENKAASISSSGMHDCLARLAENPALDGRIEMPIAGGIAVATIVDWSDDGIDNDGDGGVDDEGEELLVGVRCEGWVNAEIDGNGDLAAGRGRSDRAVTEVLLRRNRIEFNIDQSVYIDDPLSVVDISGNSFVISGFDTNLDGSKGAAGDRPAIGVPDDPAFIVASIAHNQEDNIKGLGGSPSIMQVNVLELGDAIDAVVPAAKVVWDSESASHTGTLGSVDTPLIAHAAGDLTIYGGTEGAGILIVEGDLFMKGNFTYSGLIICGGSVHFRGGGQQKDIFGGILCLGDLSARIWGDEWVESEEADEHETTEISGGVNILYSTEGLKVATDSLTSSFTVLSWAEQS